MTETSLRTERQTNQATLRKNRTAVKREEETWQGCKEETKDRETKERLLPKLKRQAVSL